MRAWFLLITMAGVLWAGDAEPLRVGMDLSYPPFETIAPDGQPEGVSVELARGLAEHLGRPLRIENIPFAGLIPALKSGKIDLIISSMTATPERAKSIDFSRPYLTTGLAALVQKDGSVHTPDDLDRAGSIVVVRQGTTGEVFTRKNFRHARILTLEKESACVLEVVQGKADAFIYDQMSVFQNARKHPEKTRPLLAPLQTESWAVGLRPGDDVLREQTDIFLDKFRADGGFDRLAEHYLSEERAAFEQAGIPFVF